MSEFYAAVLPKLRPGKSRIEEVPRAANLQFFEKLFDYINYL